MALRVTDPKGKTIFEVSEGDNDLTLRDQEVPFPPAEGPVGWVLGYGEWVELASPESGSNHNLHVIESLGASGPALLALVQATMPLSPSNTGGTTLARRQVTFRRRSSSNVGLQTRVQIIKSTSGGPIIETPP